MWIRLFFSLQARFIHVKHLLGPATPLLDGPETIWVGSSSVFDSDLSLSRVLHIMVPIAGLKLIKSAHSGDEFGYWAHLLTLEVVGALLGLLFGVIGGHIQALTLPMIQLHEQHLFRTDHDVGLARRHLGRTTTCPCFYG